MLNFQKVVFESSYGRADQLPECIGPELVFSGRSNVGKSSLLNRVFQRKSLARVSATPGKTATINFYRCDNIRFADLPGYGYAKVSKAEQAAWRRLVNGYFGAGRDIRLVVQLVDCRHPASREDMGMIAALIEGEIPFVVVATKCDKLSNAACDKALEALEAQLDCEGLTLLPCSAVTGAGVDSLCDILREVCDEEDAPQETEAADSGEAQENAN